MSNLELEIIDGAARCYVDTEDGCSWVLWVDPTDIPEWLKSAVEAGWEAHSEGWAIRQIANQVHQAAMDADCAAYHEGS